MEVRFVEGVRVSDPETVEVAKMVLLGKVNSDIVSRLNRHGQPAVGLSGEDGTPVRDPAPSRTPSGSASSARSSGWTSTSSTTSPRTTSRWSPRPAPTARATPTTSTRTPPPARSPRRSAPTRRSSSPTSPAGSPIPTIPARSSRGPSVDEVARRPRSGRRRHAAEARRLRRGDPRRGLLGPHHRRLGAALAAAGAVHGRRDRHDGDSVNNPPTSSARRHCLRAGHSRVRVRRRRVGRYAAAGRTRPSATSSLARPEPERLGAAGA